MTAIVWVVAAAGVLAPASPLGAAEVAFRRHVLNEDSAFCACAVSDVNGDGRLDVVCGAYWYEAAGAAFSFERRALGEVEKIRGRFDGYSHLPFDVDGDGWTDFINVNYRSQSMFWMRHPGVALGQPWEKHTIALPGAMETGRLVDVDGDGELDILPNGVKFAAWWEIGPLVDEGPGVKRRFIRHDLPAEVAGHGVGFGDIDGDGRGDLVGPRGWLAAPQDARAGAWEWRAEFALDPDASIPILVVDVDGDGDNDIVWGRGHNYGLFWLEQTRAEAAAGSAGRAWRRREIDTSWSQAHAPLWVDLDGNGRAELVAGKRYMAHEGKDPGAYDSQVIFRYEYDREECAWRRHDVSRGQGVGFGLDPKAADMDADGDLDLVAPGRSGLYILENRLIGDSAGAAALPVAR